MINDIAISVQDLTKSYRLYDKHFDRLKEVFNPFGKIYHHNFYALNEVTFNIKKGETVGILGKNGSGKSTLLKIITGVLTPTSGRVIVNGKVSALLELGAGFNPELTGIENVYFNGTLLGYSKEEIDKKMDDILTFADIGEFVNQPVKTYSSGMFVRLAFALAINVDPEILIVDEALSVGDALFQSRCIDRINKMRQKGVTLLFVTHSIATFQSLCDYGILLDDGMVCQIAGTNEIAYSYFKLQREREQEFSDKQNQQIGHVEKESKSVIEIEKKSPLVGIKERFGTQQANITEFTIYNHEGLESLSLESGKKFSIKLRIDFYDNVYNPIASIMIKNVQGLKLLGIHTYHGNRLQFGQKIKGDHLEVLMESEMLLNPGTYVVGAATSDHISDHDYNVLDSIDNILAIEVYANYITYGLIYNHSNITLL